MKKLIFVFLIVAGLIHMPSLCFAQPPSLYSRFDGKTLKTYLADPIDQSKGHEMEPSVLKSSIQKALEGRKSVRFTIVETPEEADIRIDTTIQGFFWTNSDPIDVLIGAAAIAIDTAVVEDYASLQALVTITDMKTSRVLWQDQMNASVTKKPMSQVESLPLVSDDFAKGFVIKSFGKKRS